MIDLFVRPLISYIFGKSTKGKQVELPKLFYEKFTIENFKGLKEVEISFVRNNLLLLLGLNESGKTTILKAIEAFDFLNDPSSDSKPKYFSSIKKKSDVYSNTSAKITAKINIESKLEFTDKKQIGGKSISATDEQSLNDFIDKINSEGSVTISRVFPFKDGNPQPYYYQIVHKDKFTKTDLSKLLAQEIVNICPYIIYFEDFKDRIPEEIFINESSDAYDASWYDIIDGLFYNTDENYNIELFKQFFSKSNPRIQDSKIVMKKVNKTLNKVFTKRWKKLSGVKGIESAELDYDSSKKCFQLNVFDTNGSNFTPEERSRGAIWYLSFLMKTEFRSKKLRRASGKPVFLIDEPASNLHSSAQESMVDDFIKLAKDTSIIYTTHSQYLVSLENIKNTYVIKKNVNGLIKAIKWSDFLQDKQNKRSYYQPIADLLQLLPNSLDIPWKNAILTEGPSDRKVLIVMDSILDKKLSIYAIYPGTSANHLKEIISLNIGWNSNFKVFLDSDKEGLEAAESYKKVFNLTNEVVKIPRENHKIENCFTKDEKLMLYKLAFTEENVRGKVSKKEFDAIFSLLLINKVSVSKIRKCFTDKTINLFSEIIDLLTE